MTVPNKEGFFWAKMVEASNMPKGEDWISGEWEVVEVIDNNGEGDDAFGVFVGGVGPMQWPKNFTWGPEVKKPKELT